ncbi:hypothetical protein BcepSauron_211 [Burkholderia phage BcepSauron]|uniref:Uncharacterized protein n=1 Tax=Burkholderia phage BcepSauron TaxID=2530033 RepID=A0A482MKL9_9CAUD|nr:hypothetical protein H1O17_gp211 [Burkholderia phage BcepSauron]QBQ74591.1 hypothetical protein BcepSauron_211 [Burkholderia phage BcepSauron]
MKQLNTQRRFECLTPEGTWVSVHWEQLEPGDMIRLLPAVGITEDVPPTDVFVVMDTPTVNVRSVNEIRAEQAAAAQREALANTEGVDAIQAAQRDIDAAVEQMKPVTEAVAKVAHAVKAKKTPSPKVPAPARKPRTRKVATPK